MTVDLKKLFETDELINDKMRNALLKAIKQNAIQDFDYLKFKQSVSSMIAMGMEKTTAVKSAFATASTMGLTKDKLVKTAHFYKGVLDKERDQFAVALKNQIAIKIDGKRVEAEKMAKEIKSHQAKIEQLKKEIEIYQKKVDQVENVVAKEKSKIEKTRDDFKNTFDHIYSQIEEDLIQMESIL